MSDPAFIYRQYIIKNLIVNNNVLILTSGTGLGKTTKVPLFMIELFTKKGLLGGYKIIEPPDPPPKVIIIHTPLVSNNSSYDDFKKGPQQMDHQYPKYDYKAKSYSLSYIDEKSHVLCAVPKKILVSQNSSPQSFLNKSIKNNDNDNNNGIISGLPSNIGEALTFLTSGYLNSLLIRDPYLTRFGATMHNPEGKNISCVILDEAHERSLDIDILLVNLKKILLIRPDFKVVIMSATINTDLFSKYFFNAPVYHVNPINEQYQVTVNYLTKPCFNYIYAILVQLEILIQSLPLGQHILIFVSGSSDKKILFKELNIDENSNEGNFMFGRAHYDVKYVDASYKGEFDFQSSTIFIATNVIESSVTIPRLKFVIDTGLAFNSSYDSKLDIDSLNINAITVPSAEQRKGRVGRTMPGECYRLYTKHYFDTIMKKETIPEIFKTNLETLFIKILNKKQNFLNFDFIQCPSKEQCYYTMQKLIKYNIIPDNYNICTIYDDLDVKNKNNIQFYNDLSYIKSTKKPNLTLTLTIDNILLHVLKDISDNEDLQQFGIDLIKVIIVISLYLTKDNLTKVLIEPRLKWDPSEISKISEIFFIYDNVVKNFDNITKIDYFLNDFVDKFVTLMDPDDYPLQTPPNLIISDDNKKNIIIQINKILIIHGHTCKIGEIEFMNNSDNLSKYYFGSQNIDYTNNSIDYNANYTYITGLIINNSIKLSLLSPEIIRANRGGEYKNNKAEDKAEDNDEYDNEYEADDNEYEDKYINF